MTVLRTQRLTLRHAEARDLEAMHGVLSDPEAMRYWSTLPHATIAETRIWLDAMIAAGPDCDDFIIDLDGRAIGKMGFWQGSEIGYLLARDQWGRGYASEAMAAVLDHAFATRAFDTVTADVDPRNAASIALLTRFGFRQTGYAKDAWCIGGVFSDSVYFALERAEWTGS